MSVKGILFDFDGLILDTEEPEYSAWKEIYKSYGAELPLLTWTACLGTSDKDFDVVDYLSQQTGMKLDAQILHARQHKRSMEMILPKPPLPGVVNYLQTAQALNLRIGLASSSPRWWVVEHLSRLRLVSYFDCIVTQEDVEEVKPDPALYQRALKILKLQPEHAVAFEDSPNGVRAAKAAGIFCVAVPNNISKHLDLSHADLVISSMADYSLEDIFQRKNWVHEPV